MALFFFLDRWVVHLLLPRVLQTFQRDVASVELDAVWQWQAESISCLEHFGTRHDYPKKLNVLVGKTH